MAQKAADVSGRVTRMSGEEFLKSIHGGSLEDSLAPAEWDPPGSPGEAMEKARRGELSAWHRPYQPGAEVYAFSEVVALGRRIGKIELMLEFLIKRLDE